ncbi:MAG: hypothetical protein JKY14_11595 [Paraglaciecola sp.]|nr:hypothetical protein [Paraglaciecola sp.]
MRQFLAVLQVIPLASIGTYFIIVLGLVTAWPLLDHSMLIGWALALSTIASGNLVFWWHYLVKKKTKNFNKFISRFLVFDLALAALLYTCFSIELFSQLDVHSRVVLTSIIAAFTATGALMFASLPMAGILWSLCLVAATGIGILVTHD